MPILGANSSGGSRPSAPVIGSATDGGTGTTASVAFTPSTYIGKGTITYTATSSPGSITATSSSSPITVSGLTTGTAYTFTVQGTTNYGIASAVSSASNSVTPAIPTSFESIGTAAGNGSASAITLSSISQSYTHLQIRYWAKSTWAPGAISEPLRMQFNGDATSGAYYFRGAFSAGYGVGYTTGNYSAFGDVFAPTASNLPANVGGVGVMDILNYKSTTIKKQVSVVAGVETSDYYTGNVWGVAITSGFWNNTSAISSITFSTASGAPWTSDTYFAVYGIKVT